MVYTYKMVNCSCGCESLVPEGLLLTVYSITNTYDQGATYFHTIQLPDKTMSHWKTFKAADFKTMDYLSNNWPVTPAKTEYKPASDFTFFTVNTEALQAVTENFSSVAQFEGISSMLESQPKENQEETDAKWRPWFDSLTDNEQLVIIRERPVSTYIFCELDENGVGVRFKEFPQVSELTWELWKDTLHQPPAWLSILVKEIPAMKTAYNPYEYIMPCGCGASEAGAYDTEDGTVTYLYSIIIHLNDRHSWSYIEIANWLDTLGLDLSFRSPYDDTRESLTPPKELKNV